MGWGMWGSKPVLHGVTLFSYGLREYQDASIYDCTLQLFFLE